MKTASYVTAFSFFSLMFLFPNNSYSQITMDLTVLDDQISINDLSKEVKMSFGKDRRANPKHAKQRGMIATGLAPKFEDNVSCRGIDDYWAMDYSKKRGREAYHGGIDIPAPKGTPILAVASGVVVAKYMNEQNPKGIEIVIRHSPKDTGLSFWTYTQYTHLKQMPDLKIGQRINMGDVIGQTSNTGMSGRQARAKHGSSGRKERSGSFTKIRRNALHLGAIYSDTKKYAKNEKMLIPKNAYWMDPNALYKKEAPYDSHSLKKLSNNEKQISIPYMLDSGEIIPKDTKVIWPYTCKKR